MTGFIVPFFASNTITMKWGKTQRRQALELRVYKTRASYYKKGGVPFDDYRAKTQLAPTTRAFVVMPIQGEKYGDQDQQRIHKEYDERFDALEEVLGDLDCYAFRIGKEAPLDGLVDRIKDEIRKASFTVADLTDERPSCYFEVGFAEVSAWGLLSLVRPLLRPASPNRFGSRRRVR